MNKIRLSVLLALSLSSASAFASAGGGLGTRNVNTELRTRTLVIPGIRPTASGDVTLGTDGVVALINPGINTHVLTSTSIAALPYPAKLDVVGIDVGSNNGNTITCSSVTIKGFSQYGNPISETLTSLNETAQETTKVFESITGVTAVCVNGGGATTDFMRISASGEVGLGFDIKSADAIISLCVVNTGTSYTCLKPGADDAATVFDNAGSGNRIDLVNDSIELDTLTTNTVDDGDAVVIRFRAPGQ